MTTGDTAPKKPRSRLLRATYFVLGLVCLGFAYLSFLPGIPTFDFVFLAAFFFARSSDRFHAWLVNHKVFGRIINGYRGGLTLRMKVVATAGILTSLSFSGFVLTSSQLVRTIIGLVGIYAVWFVWSRPRKVVGAATT
ncbi:MAG TPA: YbaN family protein [Acidimicrobiia bacterium]|nr:YbaN family protein [Acidimicrobiia bacterium]